jgi:hypothetical protein
VTDTLGRVAELGDSVSLAGARLQVVGLRGRSVDRVAITAPPAAGAEDLDD